LAGEDLADLGALVVAFDQCSIRRWRPKSGSKKFATSPAA
jgi:hypothetical protein